MKTDIHPEYGTTEVVCSCGNTFTTRSTAGESMHVELCNECHPFFTGKQKLVDSGGRVERFQRRYGKKTFTDEAPGGAVAAEEVVEVPADAAPDSPEPQPEASDEVAADAVTEEASGAEA